MHALITGGSSGIGAATAQVLHREAWRVTDLSRRSGVDVSIRDQLDKALDEAHLPDALIYSAGHVEVGPLADVTDDEWDYQVEVNLTAAFRCLRWFAGLRRRGAVVLVSSTAGTRPSPHWAPYAAAKAALANLAATAAAELAPDVRVYCVAPGRCATPLRSKLAPGENPATIMQPVSVAKTIAHLVINDHCGVLAGQTIEVKNR